MIVTCANCGEHYDAAGLAAGAALACACGDRICIASAEELEAAVVKQYIERYATACGTTADALATEGGL